MAGKSKWLKGAEPEDRLESVAEQAIESRLDLVWEYLSMAAEKWQESAENVHQLRVWSRRGMAAMSIFADLLPHRRARWMNKQLKRVRRAAGTARDLDVLAVRLAARAEPQPGAPYLTLHALAVAERNSAQQPICEMHARLARKDFCRREAALVERIRLRTAADKVRRPTYAAAAPAALRPLVEEFLAALKRPSGDYAVLHALRLQGKKLRYAMEIFAAALPSSLREDIYPQIASIQDRLGEINDHATARQHLLKWRKEIFDPETAAALAGLVDEEQNAMDASRDAFLEWLTPEVQQRLDRGFHDLLRDDSLNGASHNGHTTDHAGAHDRDASSA
jgi:CHAD domain-containing protein